MWAKIGTLLRLSGEGVRAWVDRNTAMPMLAAAGIGVGLVVASLHAFARACPSGAGGLCKMAHTSPPWLLLTSLVAGPSALLTWYWRTAHKKAEMASAIRAQVAQRFATAVGLLENQGVAALGAIYALEQIAKDSPADQWTITETLAAFLRSSSADADQRPKKQAALTVLARRDLERDRKGGIVDLKGANLTFLNFDGLNLRSFDMTDAAVDGATFLNGVDLTGAVFRPARIYHPDEDDGDHGWEGPSRPVVDDALKATEDQQGVFIWMKAHNEDAAKRTEGRAAAPPVEPPDPSG